MRIYFRGDSRDFDEIITRKNGFKRKIWYRPSQGFYSLFRSSNAIALSSELSAAAAFPLTDAEKNYVYFVRGNSDELYNLYGRSLSTPFLPFLSAATTLELAWSNEWVSEKNIPTRDIIGCVEIYRYHDPARINALSSLSSFRMVEFRQNPEIKDFSRSEQLLISQVKSQISAKIVITSSVPRRKQIVRLTPAMASFHHAKAGLDPSSHEMFYAAWKAKVLGMHAHCQKQMADVLCKIFDKCQPPQSKLGFLRCCSNRAANKLKAFFQENVIDTRDDIAGISDIERCFLSLFQLCQQDRKVANFIGRELCQKIDLIIHEYRSIDKATPQLPVESVAGRYLS